jgi:hypothetical protein
VRCCTDNNAAAFKGFSFTTFTIPHSIIVLA